MHMRKNLLLLTGLLLFLFNTLNAQTIEITGRVLDNNGTPVVGASIQERNSNRGTTSDENGYFRISTRQGATLIITSVGFGRSEVVVGTTPNINVTLTTADASLSEVVVTAMGVRRDKKALGYAVTTVDKAQLEQRPEGDIARVLQGKTPGVDIGATSGLSGSGTNILIRGVSTINGNSTPLFVVDGVPFDASTNAQSDFRFGNQTSSRFLDIDPNNIESVSVLRGLSATTLYGELGRNGVILITTKNGSNRRIANKTEVTVTQSLFANTVASLPDWQNTYGGGFHQSLGFAFYSNWGAAFENPPVMVAHPYSRPGNAALSLRYQSSFPELQGAEIPNIAAPNNVNDFFRTGWINTTSINLAGSPGANTNISGNYTFFNDKGFTPGNDLRKHTFGVGGNTLLANKITLNSSINISFTDYQTPPNSASTGSGPQYANYPGIFADILYTPRGVDLMNWPFEFSDGGSAYYRGPNDIQNPRWTAKYVKFRQAVQRTFGQMSAGYEIARNFNLTYRIGMDTYGEENTLQSPKGGVQVPLGVYRTTNGRNTIWNHNLVGTYATDLSDDIDLTATFGGRYFKNSYNQTGIFSENQLVFNVWNHQNFINSSPRGESGANLNTTSEVHQKGLFAEGTFGYRNFLYATLGASQGWVSTLEPENNSQFYPSVSLSFIPTAALEGLRSNDWINYTKLRVGYGTSARFPEAPYTTRPALNINSAVFADRTGGLVNSNTIPNLLPNPNLRPELLKEIEFGLEGSFIKNRLNLDFTWYNRKATDQILFRQLDPSTGYTSQQINGGDVVNRGIEIGAGVNIIRGRNFNWTIDGNFTRNRNEVTALPDGIDQLVVSGFTDLGGFAIVGQPLGIMQGYYVQRYSDPNDPNKPGTGQLIIDDIGNYLFSTEIGIIGDPNPDFKASLSNTLGFRGLSFRMQWDYTQGGDIYSATIRSLLARGLTKDTEMDRMAPFVLPGVRQDGTPNTIQNDATNIYFNSLGFGPSDRSVFDGTVIRLREISLSYALPESLLSRTPFGGLSLTLSGQNLWYNAPNTPKYMNFDPETSGLGTGSYRGFEFITGPSSRRIGGSIRLTF
jgi:TonB-linked SusC/RagA family outer membrane protein